MRPIDADALIRELKGYFCDYLWAGEGAITQEDAIIMNYHRKTVKIIEETPTVERPRGEWIKTFRCKGEDINNGAILSLYYYDCPKCKYRTGNQGKEFYFCPNCGADMRGEGE